MMIGYIMSNNRDLILLKIDNQVVTERMAEGQYRLDFLSGSLHGAFYRAVNAYMDGIVINCMDMMPEAYLHFGNTPVARAVEDYFPERDNGIGYDMERGGAAAHLVMALYNNLYFSQLVYTDFDMFESDNTYALYHAMARAINNGPIYVTDKPGKQCPEVLKPLVYSDGQLIRPCAPLLLTQDCLFLGQKPGLMKAFSHNVYGDVLGIWNMADTEMVQGCYSPQDIDGICGNVFVCYDYFSGKVFDIMLDEHISLKLGRMGYALLHFYPKREYCTPLGLIDKYNVSGTLEKIQTDGRSMKVCVGDGGTFAASMPKAPVTVKVDGRSWSFRYEGGLALIDIPVGDVRTSHEVVLSW